MIAAGKNRSCDMESDMIEIVDLTKPLDESLTIP
jgi:hypothetical protein